MIHWGLKAHHFNRLNAVAVYEFKDYISLNRHISHFMHSVSFPSPQRPRILVQVTSFFLFLYTVVNQKHYFYSPLCDRYAFFFHSALCTRHLDPLPACVYTLTPQVILQYPKQYFVEIPFSNKGALVFSFILYTFAGLFAFRAKRGCPSAYIFRALSGRKKQLSRLKEKDRCIVPEKKKKKGRMLSFMFALSGSNPHTDKTASGIISFDFYPLLYCIIFATDTSNSSSDSLASLLPHVTLKALIKGDCQAFC